MPSIINFPTINNNTCIQGNLALQIPQPVTFLSSIDLNPKYDFHIEEAVDYSIVVDDLHCHGNINAWIASAYKEGPRQKDYKQHFFKKDNLVINKHNSYISPSTYVRPSRDTNNLYTINAFWSDIDCYNTKYTKKEVIRDLIFKIFCKELPLPSYLLDTGNGLLALWILDDPLIVQKRGGGINNKALTLWTSIQKMIHKKLRKYGADPAALDPVHMIRPSKTINEKSKTSPKPVKVECQYEKYLNINDFIRYLPAFEDKYPVFDCAEYFEPTNYGQYIDFGDEKDKVKAARPKNYERLNLLREQDLLKLLDLRNYEVYGMRNAFLVQYISHNLANTNGDYEQTLGNAIDLNNLLISKEKLTPNDIKDKVNCAFRIYNKQEKAYCYKTAKIIELLAITKEEQKYMQTLKFESKMAKQARLNTAKKEVKKLNRRNPSGMTNRQASSDDTKNKIIKLNNKGLNNTQIALKLGYSVRHIRRIINQKS